MMRNQNVEIVREGLLINGEIVPMIGGEYEYWRSPASRWSQILDTIKNDLGIHVISTMVAWIFHETEPFVWDFEGKTKPERNLKGFLELVKSKGMYCIIRPGPWMYAEEENLGIPDHSAIFGRNSDEFKDRAIRYIEAVSKVLVPYLFPNGGPIVVFQPDNEINPWHFWFWRDLGLDGGNKKFQHFLRSRYSQLSELNQAWGTNYSSWEKVKSQHRIPEEGDPNIRSTTDFTSFLFSEANEQGRWNIEAYRKNGIQGIPYCHNLLGFNTVHDWHDLNKQVDFVGMDIYPQANFEGSAKDNVFMSGGSGHNDFVDVCRVGAELGKLSYMAELQGGYCPFFFPGGYLYANHYRMSFATVIGAGIRSWDWFMLVDREHWMASVISTEGALNPRIKDEYVSIVKLFHEYEMNKTEKMGTLGVIYDPFQTASGVDGNEVKIRSSLYAAGIDYRRIDGRNAEAMSRCTHLIYAGGDFLQEESQINLKKWVEAGGILITFGKGIFKNERLESFNHLGFEPVDRSLFVWGYRQTFEMHYGKISLGMEQPVYTWDEVEGAIHGKMIPQEEAINLKMVDRMRNLDYELGYQKQVGKGKLVVIGGVPFSECLPGLLKHLQLEIPVMSKPGNIYASGLKGKNQKLLTIVNAGREAKYVSLELSSQYWSGVKTFKDIYTNEFYHVEGNRLVVSMKEKQGVILVSE